MHLVRVQVPNFRALNQVDITFEKDCKIILKSNRIDNKIVVLCEGKIPKLGGRGSPLSLS